MNPVLDTFIGQLALEKLEENLFRGAIGDTLIKRVYGGKVLGEASTAAQLTVAPDRALHSLHAYFLREADSHSPVIYSVERSRDGKSFSARRVTAIQHGQPIFTLEASFHRQESGIEYQRTCPTVPPPEEIPAVVWSRDRIETFPPRLQRMVRVIAPFEIRALETREGGRDAEGTPIRRAWVKAIDALPDNPVLHRAMLAYLSDYGLIWTLLAHHGFQITNENLVVASLDHAMWFHRPFRMDEWLLYYCEGVSSAGARGLARGTFYNQAGELVVSVAQEGLMRVI
jgi:acyl-CoA thioesterase-2